MSDQRVENPSAETTVPENEPEVDGYGFPKVPEPDKWPSEYGLDEATALAIVPERALIFWELASLIKSGLDNLEFRLIRMKLVDDEPVQDKDWPVKAVGRFQDSGLEPGADYIWIVARDDGDEQVPLLVTNPVRMPIRVTPSGTPTDLPTSSEHLLKTPLKKSIEEDGK